jgi:hypothetical protein
MNTPDDSQPTTDALRVDPPPTCSRSDIVRVSSVCRELRDENDSLKKAIRSALLELYPPARSASCRRIVRAVIGEDPNQIYNNERPERESETSVHDERTRSPISSDTLETDKVWDGYITPPYPYCSQDIASVSRKLERERNEAVRLLKRYRDETPLGNQPHMIAGEVDEFLSENAERIRADQKA